MKTVTQNFKDAQKAPSPVMVRQVWYKRRYWQESTKSYIWETNWTQYTEDKIVQVSNVTWQLDIQTLNQFKTSNVTLTVENLKNQWRNDNPYGIFSPDATSPIYGYYPYWMKFQIRAGLQFGSSHTTEVVNIFTGVATEYTVDSATGAMQITLTGEEALVIGSNAESVSTTVTNEVLTGAVDGSNKVFTTAHNGVGIFSEVSDNGITKRAGTDYTISQLNDPLNPGKITFIAAPTAGHTVRGSYLYWKTTQKFEDLVTALLNQAGIPGGNQFVSPVTFPSNIINTHIWQVQADWNGGSLTAIDSASIPNSIEYLYSNAQTWNNATTGWTVATYNFGTPATFNNDGTGDYFLCNETSTDTSKGIYAYRSLTQLYGDWIMTFNFPADPGINGQARVVFGLIVGAVGTPAFPTVQLPFQNALVMDCQVLHGGTTFNNISMYLTDGSGSTINGSAFLNGVAFAFNTNYTIRVRARPNVSRTFDVYLNGVFLYTFSSSTTAGTIPTSNTYFGYFSKMQMTNGQKLYFLTNGISTPTTTTGQGVWVSAAVDFGATPNAWTQLLYTQTLNGGAVTYYTATSADNITYDAYVVLPGNQVPGSALRRYVQVKIVIDISNGDPVVTNASIGAVTSSTTITLANFTGMSCYDAITALAKFCNYEFGFDGSENFFFRPKNPGNTPVFTFTESDFGIRIVQKVNGYDRVYSKIRASYAGYLKDIADDGLNYQGPLPRSGYNLLQVDGGSILISSDADVATGLAGSFFNYYRLPRRRVKVQTKIIPQLDISDVVSASFQDLYPTRWFIGDTSTYVGDSSKSLYGPEEQVLQALNMKVVGMRIDTEAWQTEFDLEEVI